MGHHCTVNLAGATLPTNPPTRRHSIGAGILGYTRELDQTKVQSVPSRNIQMNVRMLSTAT